MSALPACLLSLDCGHDYFADGVCRPLLPRPSTDCAARLRGLGWRVRSTYGRADVWAPAGAALSEAGPLVFWLENADRFLSSYTEGGNAGTGLWYFDDDQFGGEAVRSGILNARDGASAMVRLPSAARRLQLPIAGGSRPAAWSLHARGTALLDGAVPPAGPLEIDLSGLPEGRYLVALDGVAAHEFVLCGDPPPTVWGLVVLYGQDAPGQRLRRVQLRSRRVRWRYHVSAAGADGDGLERGAVTGTAGGRPLDFGAPEAGSDGVRAVARFTSAEALPLRERPAPEFDLRLILPTSTVGLTRELRLPFPQPATLVRSGDEGPGPVSDIHVYL